MTNLQIALIRYREEKRINQEQLAGILGVTRSAIANWETGRSTPKSEIYTSIAEKLGLDVKYLLGISNERNTASTQTSLNGVKLALYNQLDELTEDQAKDALKYIEFLKSKEDK